MMAKLTKEQKEDLIANLFCEHLGAGWEVVTHLESPDFLLSDGHRSIGLELTELRQLTAQDRAIDYDRDFRRAICDAWLNDQSVHHWYLCLRYRLAGGDEFSGRYTVPEPKERAGVIQELKDLVRTLSPPQAGRPIEIRFRGDNPHAAAAPRGRRFRWVDEAFFPALHDCFYSLRVSHDPTIKVGYPGSWLDGGSLGVMKDHLAQHLDKKLGKLAAYRNRVPPEAKTELLIWSSGGSCTRRLKIEDADTIRSVVEDAQALADDQFDSVWWGRDMLLENRDGPAYGFVKIL